MTRWNSLNFGGNVSKETKTVQLKLNFLCCTTTSNFGKQLLMVFGFHVTVNFRGRFYQIFHMLMQFHVATISVDLSRTTKMYREEVGRLRRTCPLQLASACSHSKEISQKVDWSILLLPEMIDWRFRRFKHPWELWENMIVKRCQTGYKNFRTVPLACFNMIPMPSGGKICVLSVKSSLPRTNYLKNSLAIAVQLSGQPTL